jgi:hypothetical protein
MEDNRVPRRNLIYQSSGRKTNYAVEIEELLED